jgi:hypothetical protein
MYVFQTDVYSRIEETLCLRELLNQTREELEHEKRLNAAIKARKVNLLGLYNLPASQFEPEWFMRC